MKTHQFELLLGAVLVALFVAFWIWQTPGNLQKLSSVEVEAYLHRMEGKLPGDPAEQAAFLARMRAFGLADDGRPVYMLNLVRYYPELKRRPGMEGVRGTPGEANTTYEKAVMPILFRLGGYPLFGGETMEVRAERARRTVTSTASIPQSTTGAAFWSCAIRAAARSSSC